jgi:hypothetical protein
VYTPNAPGGGRTPPNPLTDVFLPGIQYPHGYVAHVSGGFGTKVANGRHLIVRANPGAKVVAVTVTPR